MSLNSWHTPFPSLPGCKVSALNLHAAIAVCCDFPRFLYLSVSLSERLLGLLLHKHLAAVCAICAFSQQVITNRSLTSHSVQLDSQCWHGQGHVQEEAGWQQLDSAHYGIKGKAAESQWRKLQWGENIWRKMCAFFLASLAVSSHVILSFIVLNIQESKNGFVILQIYQMRSVSTFWWCTIWLPCGLHNTVRLCMTGYWICDTLQ